MIENMSGSVLVLALLVIGLVLWLSRHPLPLPLPFRARVCQGSGWRRAFPTASRQDIRAFLSVFADSFAFHESEKLQFRPGDTIYGVYRALYPSRWTPDALEVEMMGTNVERKYGVKLEDIWSTELTLGHLFSRDQDRLPTTA
jgi:propanediol dehydratase small subunit